MLFVSGLCIKLFECVFNCCDQCLFFIWFFQEFDGFVFYCFDGDGDIFMVGQDDNWYGDFVLVQGVLDCQFVYVWYLYIQKDVVFMIGVDIFEKVYVIWEGFYQKFGMVQYEVGRMLNGFIIVDQENCVFVYFIFFFVLGEG